MQNNYLLESSSSISINKEIDKIIKDANFLNATKSIYDLSEVLLDDVLEDLDTYSFLSDKKVIIINNLDSMKVEQFKDSIEHLYKYLENPSSDNLLFICSSKFNNTLKLTKELKKRMTFIEITTDPIKFTKEALKDYKIDKNLFNYISEKCLGDINKIENECNKLKNYKLVEKEILKSDIDLVVTERLGDSTDLTFQFNRCLAERNTKKALEKYYELLNYNIEPLSILGLLASQIRIIYQVKVLEKRRMNANEIATTLGEKNSYRVKKTMELTRYYTEDELLKLMIRLSDIDLKIKTTDTDPNLLIELFILENKM